MRSVAKPLPILFYLADVPRTPCSGSDPNRTNRPRNRRKEREMGTLTEGSMKFITNGRTFDTATSTRLAINRGVYTPPIWGHDTGDVPTVRYVAVLYRTANGTLFIHERKTTRHRRGKPVVEDLRWEVSHEQAVTWMRAVDASINPMSANFTFRTRARQPRESSATLHAPKGSDSSSSP